MQEPTLSTRLEAFFQQFPVTGFTKGELIISAHSEINHFYFIETGAVKMAKTTKDGKKIIFHIFFPRSFFSLLSLIDSSRSNYDFITLVPTTVRKVPKSELLAFFKNDNESLLDLQYRLLKGLQGLLWRIEQISLNSALTQIASLLYYFARHFGDEEHKFVIPITHQEIADWLGMSRENVSIKMKELEKSKVIAVNDRRIEVIDESALKQLAESE